MNKRRFIAGAVCPQCKLADKIVVLSKEGVDVRQCVSCGFEEQKNFLSQSEELPTRVNQTSHEKENIADDVVRFVEGSRDS